MRFRGQGSKRHRGAHKAPGDLSRGLYLVEANGSRGFFFDLNEFAQSLRLTHRREGAPLPVSLCVAGRGRLLRGAHRDRVVRVMLARLPKPDATVVCDRGRPGPRGRLDVVEVGAADS